MSKFICSHPWTHFEVNNPNGDVTMCCDNNTVLGNVNDKSIAELWNDEGFQNIRRRMRDDGAHAICPRTCPVLNGFKTYQNLDWYTEIDTKSPARINAEQNEQEFKDGNLVLESLPRWMRYAYSYLCNLDCYHCYQREEAVEKIKLPDSFMDQVREHSENYQVLHFFGGEPFLYKPVLKMMENIKTDKECRYFLISNATLFTDRVLAMLETKNIGHFAISLDAATESSFNLLRLKDAKSSWAEVLENTAHIAKMKKDMGFTFTISMTLNSVNHDEIERFVDLCIGFDAEPLVILVANPYQTYEFQKDFLMFADQQINEIEEQIERSLPKVEKHGYQEAEMALKSLQRTVREHYKGENNTRVFVAKKYARRVFHHLPTGAQNILRKTLQK